MAYIEAERFAALKARVKAECLRRCHTGSVAEYGGEKYEYTNSPTEDHTVDVEHYEKLALPLSKIHSEKVPSLDGRRIVFDEDITEFEAARAGNVPSPRSCDPGCGPATRRGAAPGSVRWTALVFAWLGLLSQYAFSSLGFSPLPSRIIRIFRKTQ